MSGAASNEGKEDDSVSASGNSNWMSCVSDSLALNQITMPGTHDSCAHACSELARCQRLTLGEQLEAGVRFVDVRCRHVDDRFELYHSSFSLGDRFDSGVVDVCVRFLRAHPTEALVMLVSPEHTAKRNLTQFDDLFLQYIESTRPFWILDSHEIPSLGRSRGKILLLRRFWSSKPIPFGIDMSGWKYNATFRIKNCPAIEFYIQDEFKLMVSEKWLKVKEVLETAATHSCDSTTSTWFLNYCSAQNWPVQPPRYIAWCMNKSLKQHLASIEANLEFKCECLGVIVLDFASANLIRKIFMLNFRKSRNIFF